MPPPPPPPHFLPIFRLLQSRASTHWQRGALQSRLYTPPQIFNLSEILCSASVCCGRELASWHTGSAPGGCRHTHHHIQVPSQHVKEVELWVSFNDRCPLCPSSSLVRVYGGPLRPSGGCCFYTLRPFPLLPSKVQSALKAWPTHSGFLLDLFPLLRHRSFPLFFFSCFTSPFFFFCLGGYNRCHWNNCAFMFFHIAECVWISCRCSQQLLRVSTGSVQILPPLAPIHYPALLHCV